jgi:hypothetical protein
MMRYRLRSLLIVLAVGPPALAGIWFAWTNNVLTPPVIVGLGAYLAIVVLAIVLYLRTPIDQR